MTFSERTGVRIITGVATSITAFIGRAKHGPVNEPIRVRSFTEFVRTFGGLWIDSSLGYAVLQFFQNGGGDAIIVRICGTGAATAHVRVGGLSLLAADVGSWGNNLEATVDLPTTGGDIFNLSIKDTVTGVSEIFRNLSTNMNDASFVTKVLEQGSNLVRVELTGVLPTSRPTADTQALSSGADGSNILDNDISDSALASQKHGLWALEKADLFNLLCIPPLIPAGEIGLQTREAAANYCKNRRALFVVDPPTSWTSPSAAISGVDTLMTKTSNAAVFFPLLRAPDPLRDGNIGDFAPCGAVAGVLARTDATRGVWKTPAGIEAPLTGIAELSVKLTDGENGQLNPLGVNCLRSFPIKGCIVWGSRTLRGADQLADEYKYIPVRRLSLFIEESLYRGTQWVVFEPYEEPLWAQIRGDVDAFLHDLFGQGAFQGTTPQVAYFVKCDSDTTTKNDIDLGIVNIIVGFAPLKPAEFVVITIQHVAGQIES
jgi:phage tail sheath protein FI